MQQKELFHLDTSSLVDKVEQKIIERLKTKHLQVGDMLPKEIDLANTIGVSRTVIREALLRLRIMGLIDSKKKKGTVIISPNIFNLLSKSLQPDLLSEKTLKDIFELRLMLEVGMADMVTHRVTKQDIEELKTIVSEEREDKTIGVFNINEEIRFHGKLYEVSGNQTLKEFQKLLLPIFAYVHKKQKVNTSKTKKRTPIITHKGLIQVLETGSAELFRTAMRQHLHNPFLTIW